jgi:hypothetical protein
MTIALTTMQEAEDRDIGYSTNIMLRCIPRNTQMASEPTCVQSRAAIGPKPASKLNPRRSHAHCGTRARWCVWHRDALARTPPPPHTHHDSERDIPAPGVTPSRGPGGSEPFQAPQCQRAGRPLAADERTRQSARAGTRRDRCVARPPESVSLRTAPIPGRRQLGGPETTERSRDEHSLGSNT